MMYWPWIRILLCLSAALLATWFDSSIFSDENFFLKDFLDNDLLSVLGFVTAVTLASAANIHLQLNALEVQRGCHFTATKGGLRKSALTLILAFFVSLVIVVLKPVFQCHLWVQIFSNIAALTMIVVCLEVLWDITNTTFKIPPK